ncbi:MFS transporter [Neobacillus massiliamazoniensis]|uniref:Major facilitator superfamily protein n=1 Tax=Neobacillus massiliamazoniensis TaxID=1499688 RepID=A0A0U1P4J8_9BACI|nr:MFS transporter [Neobacillus massiliamazoniensis]CRK85180.1 major facilitator superfamily protein [Neobacillus massiliamazoniensis]
MNSSAGPNKKRLFVMNPVILVLGLISLFTDLSSNMIVPILPLYLTSVLHVQVGSIGIIEGIAESTASVLKLFSGMITDRLGKHKLLMLIGYGLSNLTKPLFALSASWTQVLIIRFSDRFGKGIRTSPRDALVADSTTKEERGKSFGFRRSMDALGAALGPLVAFGILATYKGNYRLVFWLSVIPGILAIILILFFLKEKDRSENVKQASLPKIGFKNLDRRFIWFSLIFTFFTVGNFSDAFLALRAQDAGMLPAFIPLAFFAMNLSSSIFSTPVGMLSDRFGRRSVLIAGLLTFATIYFGFGIVKSVSLVWVLFVLYGFYYAFTEGIQKAYIADIVPEGQRGTAMGTFNAMTGLAALPASIMAGYLWQTFGPMVAFSTSSAIALIAALLMIVLRI